MLGNVAEWVEDCYVGNYSDAPLDGSANTKGECNFRVVRGGSWVTGQRRMRAAFRENSAPDGRNWSIGFRLARTP